MDDFKVPRSMIWLADDNYEHLPDFEGATFVKGTEPTVDATWKSSFEGKSLVDVATWVRNVPKPPKAVCKSYFAVLQKDLYERRGMVLVCKVVEDKLEPETIPLTATHLAAWLVAYDRYKWDSDYEDCDKDP